MTDKFEHIPYIALVAVVAIVGVVVLLQQTGNSSLSSDDALLVGEAIKGVGITCNNDADCGSGLVCDWNLTAVYSFVPSPNPADKRCVPKSALGDVCASRTIGGDLMPAAVFDWECQSGLICVRSSVYGTPACENRNTLDIGDTCLRNEQCQSELCALSPVGTMVCS